MADQIDFDSTDDESVVTRTRQGIAVYTNQLGDVVIRQDGGMEDDALVLVHKRDVEALILALQTEVG